MLLTYARLDYARRTLSSVAQHLVTADQLWCHIADDGSSDEHRDNLLELAKAHFGDRVSMTNSNRHGYGASYNAATQVVHGLADLILPLEDDWEMTRPFDIDLIAGVLRDGVFGCVRMGYVGATQELRGSFVSARGRWWLELHPDSPEPHVFAGHPRLEHIDWQRAVGPWPEGLEAGLTEFAVAHRPQARVSVAWPVDLIVPSGGLFAHIGTIQADSIGALAIGADA